MRLNSTAGACSGAGGEEGDDTQARALKRPRLVWTPKLHTRFVAAVEQLGLRNAVPKTIMQVCARTRGSWRLEIHPPRSLWSLLARLSSASGRRLHPRWQCCCALPDLSGLDSHGALPCPMPVVGILSSGGRGRGRRRVWLLSEHQK